jgi:hypothetical protein
MGHSHRFETASVNVPAYDPFAEAIYDPFLQLKRDRRAESAKARHKSIRENGVADDRKRNDGVIPTWFILSRQFRGHESQPRNESEPSVKSQFAAAPVKLDGTRQPVRGERKRRQTARPTYDRPALSGAGEIDADEITTLSPSTAVQCSPSARFPGAEKRQTEQDADVPTSPVTASTPTPLQKAVAIGSVLAMVAVWGTGWLMGDEGSRPLAVSEPIAIATESQAVQKAASVPIKVAAADNVPTSRIVHLKSDPPGAAVWIGDAPKSEGNTPLLVELPSGNHSVRFSVTGFKDSLTTVLVNGESKRIVNAPVTTLIPDTVELTVRTEPAGATVCLNDRETALSPATFSVAPGKPNSIEVRMDGFKTINHRVVMKVGRDSEMHFVLGSVQQPRTVENTEQAEVQPGFNKQIARNVPSAFSPQFSGGDLPLEFSKFVKQVFRKYFHGVATADMSAIRAKADADPRAAFALGVASMQEQKPAQAVRELEDAVQLTRRTKWVWFAPQRLLIRVLLNLGNHQAAWSRTRDLVRDVVATEQNLAAHEFASAMRENLRFSGGVAAFLAGPHASTIRTGLDMDDEMTTLIASVPKHSTAFDAGKQRVLMRHSELRLDQLARMEDWNQKVADGKESGEIPRTTLNTEFEAGQYFGSQSDKYLADAGGIAFDSRVYATRQTRDRRTNVD